MKTKTNTKDILAVMQVVAWVAFVGYMIEAGAILTSYAVSYINPDAVKNLYKAVDLQSLRQLNFWYYTNTISFMVALFVMKAYVWYLVIKTLTQINLANPFTTEVVQKLEKISYVLFSTWIVGMLSSANTSWLRKVTGEVYGDYVNGEFVFMAGLVFIISQVFKRGVEIQSENELTV